MYHKRPALIACLLVLFLMVVGGCASAPATPTPEPTATLQPANVIRLTNGEWLPYTSATLPHYGPHSHIVTEAFAQEGWTVDYDFYPWARAIDLVERGSYDGSIPWLFSEERQAEGLLLYSPSPFTETCDVFFHRTDFAFDWQTVEDLQGARIGLILEYSTTKELEALKESGYDLTLDITTSEEANFQKLLLNRIDIFPAEREVGLAFLRQQLTPEEAAQITYHPVPWRCGGLHLVVSQTNPQAEALLAVFEQGLQKLRESGRYEQIMQDFATGVYDAPTP
jgi:polar amino acid transport system substrate-binding protein